LRGALSSANTIQRGRYEEVRYRRHVGRSLAVGVCRLEILHAVYGQQSKSIEGLQRISESHDCNQRLARIAAVHGCQF
jgi:hypothetical protein